MVHGGMTRIKWSKSCPPFLDPFLKILGGTETDGEIMVKLSSCFFFFGGGVDASSMNCHVVFAL